MAEVEEQKGLISWFAHNQLVTGCKSEIPPTKQEIAHPYIDKVTDNMSGHYGMRGHFFNLFLRLRAVSVPKTNALADIEPIFSLPDSC